MPDTNQFTADLNWAAARLRQEHGETAAADLLDQWAKGASIPNAETATLAPLSATERSFLRFALELAADAMANDASGFTDDDEAAHASLSKLAGEAS